MSFFPLLFIYFIFFLPLCADHVKIFYDFMLGDAFAGLIRTLVLKSLIFESLESRNQSI